MITQVIAVCSLITGIAAVIAVIVSLVKKAKEPNNVQNARLDRCENEIENLRDLLKEDNRRVEKIEEGNRIMQRCMLALLSHGIDGNDIAGMKKAKEDLQDYLINQ